jgi:ubiquinone/menaquinone biosynthesis C-methylase UbiE
VLINIYTKELSETLERVLDTRKGSNDKLLHVLDIGCGRGQDIKKWALSRVKYMVASDFSEECVKVYEERWRQKEPY